LIFDDIFHVKKISMANPKKTTEKITKPNNPAAIKPTKGTTITPIFAINTGSYTPTISDAERRRIDAINHTNAINGIDFPVHHRSEIEDDKAGKTSCGKFYFRNIYLGWLLLNPGVNGIWIWLIKDGSETKLIVSRAGMANSFYRIPELLTYSFQIHQSFNNGLTERYVDSNDLAWKNAKISEGRFRGIKGFFVGKDVLLNTATLETDGIQIEVMQDSEGFPMLCYYNLMWDNSLKGLGVSKSRGIETPSEPGVAVEATGASCSRPSPPYGE
jgi:hypothetical protein